MKTSSYWKNRSHLNKLRMLKLGDKFIDELKKVLKGNLDSIEKDIKAFYDKYGNNPAEKLSYDEFQKYKANLIKKAKKYPKDKILQKQARQDIPKYRIDRLRQLETDIQIKLATATATQENTIKTGLTEIAVFSTKSAVQMIKDGLGLTLGGISERKVKQVIMTDWVGGKNWSDRIWADREKLGESVKSIMTEGTVKGYGYRKMATELKNTMSNSFNNAFRLIRTEGAFVQASATLERYKETQEELGEKLKYKYDAFLDDRTSTICKEYNGKVFDLDNAVIGENFPPLHPNCRSTTQLIVDEDFKQKEKSKILTELENSNIEKIPFNFYEKVPTESEIIGRVGGGDMTKGSCTSLAFAYAGNKAKMKVLDFRGGKSTEFFSLTKNITSISELEGVESFIENEYNDYVAVNKLLKNVVKTKEYCLMTGKHTAIIRKVDKGFEFLELQSPYNNGFKKLTNNILKKRFGCQKTHSSAGLKLKVSSILIDIETLNNNSEFRNILEYINTDKTKQKKGIKGFAK